MWGYEHLLAWCLGGIFTTGLWGGLAAWRTARQADYVLIRSLLYRGGPQMQDLL
jgi:hypothetical protein